MTADALMSRHTSAWQAATVHPFLTGVRDGSLPEHSFDRWLAQDYLFAQALVRAQSRIAATAPLADVALLAGGVVATVGELGWFEALNGDVVFDPRLLERAQALIESDRTFACVNTAAVGEEEVKYRTDADGYLTELSKSVIHGRGEAVGINYVASADKAALIEHLERCTDQDFFERGMESAIKEGRLRVQALDISDCFVVEVDFADDLERANTEVSRTVTPAA
ncbi:MAG: hypothetical protein ACLPLP_13315 [Mycobacterium sp.]